MGYRWIRNRRDARPIALVISFFIYQLAVYLFADDWQHALLWIAIPHVVLNIPIASAMHIAIHTPIFYRGKHDFLFGLLYALEIGITRTCFRIDHLTHHRYFLEPEKDPNAWQSMGKVMGQAQYALHNLVHLYPRSWRIACERSQKVRREFIAEIVTCLVLLGVLTAYDPPKSVAVYGFCIVWGIAGTYYWSHHQHAGLEPVNVFLACRTYLGKPYNWLAFNVGYHTAHHEKPGLHWSQLPARHEAIASRIPAQLMIRRIPARSRNYPVP